MTTPHTGDLDHALSEALHAATPHFDEVAVKVLDRTWEDGTPTLYRVTGWSAGARFSGRASTATAAVAAALKALRVAMGGAA